MGINSFQSGFVRNNFVKCAFLLVLLQPLVAIPSREIKYQDNKENPTCKITLGSDFSINVVARYEGKEVKRKYFDAYDVWRMTGNCSKTSTTVELEFLPHESVFKITFFPLNVNSFAYSYQQHHLPEFRFRADTMFKELEGAEGYACFQGPEGSIENSLYVRSYTPVLCEDNKPPATKYEYYVTVNMNTLQVESSFKKSLRASDDKQAARGSVGVAIGVVLAVVAVVAVAAAVGLVVRRRINAAKSSSERSGLVTLTLS